MIFLSWSCAWPHYDWGSINLIIPAILYVPVIINKISALLYLETWEDEILNGKLYYIVNFFILECTFYLCFFFCVKQLLKKTCLHFMLLVLLFHMALQLSTNMYSTYLSVTCDSSVVFFGHSRFFHQWNWQPWYSWNIVENGVKHHNPHLYALINNLILFAEDWEYNLCFFFCVKQLLKKTCLHFMLLVLLFHMALQLSTNMYSTLQVLPPMKLTAMI
jgi:hypothetical protein